MDGQANAVEVCAANLGEAVVLCPHQDASAPALSRWTALLFAVGAGLAVANVYYAQPLLDVMALEFRVEPGAIGLVMTFTQCGLALGLLLIVPLGDLWDRRLLIVGQMLLSALALIVVATAASSVVLMAGMIAVGLMAGVVQLLVTFAADLAAPAERGRMVGTVTSGVVMGILMARLVSGLIADIAGWRGVYVVSAVAMLVTAGVRAGAGAAGPRSDCAADVRIVQRLVDGDGASAQRAAAFIVARRDRSVRAGRCCGGAGGEPRRTAGRYRPRAMDVGRGACAARAVLGDDCIH
jgi:MFS family permease